MKRDLLAPLGTTWHHLKTAWTQLEDNCGQLWNILIKFGYNIGTTWDNRETTVTNLCHILTQLLHDFDTSLRQLEDNFRSTLIELGDNFGGTLRQFWGNFGSILRQFFNHDYIVISQWLLAERSPVLWAAHDHFAILNIRIIFTLF